MRGISTLNLLLKGSLFASALFFANQASAQATTMCGEITAAFNTDAEGFTGDFTWANSHLEKNVPRSIDQTQTLILNSPAYSKQASATTVYAGFVLTGYTKGTEYKVEVYNRAGTQKLAETAVFPVSDNPNANRPATLCTPISGDDLAGVDAIRYVIYIYSPDPTGQAEVEVTITFDDFSTGNVAQAALPVDIASFKATKSTRGVQLAWTVANEVNVSRYEVLKGSDASNLKPIGIVFAGEKSAYSFTDEQPSQGISFYRLRSVDIDGKFKLSTVISFSNGKSTAILRAYPMPARNEITLQHGAIEGKAQISITSESGQIMKRVIPASGSMQTSIDLSTLKAGLYLLRLENSNGEVETLKVVKQ